MGIQNSAVFPPGYGRLIWLPIAGFLLAEIVLALFAQVPVAVPAELGSAKNPAWSEAAARLQFLGLMLLYVVMAAVLTGVFVYDLRMLFDSDSQKRLVGIYVLAVAAGASVVAAAYAGLVPRTFALVGPDLFSRALDSAEKFGTHGFWSRRVFDCLLVAINIITLIAVPAFIVGGISCLATVRNGDQKKNWTYQTQRLANYVYVSAGWLVVGTVFLKTWTQYPGYLLDKDALASHSAVVSAYTTYVGIEYTIILAAYAFPVVAILAARGEEIATSIATEEDRIAKSIAATGAASDRSSPDPTFDTRVREVREREKLGFSTQDVLKTIFAVLAPLITGGIASLASILGKG
jgi:hypothetical protein